MIKDLLENNDFITISSFKFLDANFEKANFFSSFEKIIRGASEVFKVFSEEGDYTFVICRCNNCVYFMKENNDNPYNNKGDIWIDVPDIHWKFFKSTYFNI